MRAGNVVALVLTLAPACAGAKPLAPPELHLGAQTCEECAMAISDARLAAAMIVDEPNGARRELLFDDVGCLLAYGAAHPGIRVAARYVRDYQGTGWRHAESATYLRSEDIPTPMRYGIAAFVSPQQAEAARAVHGGESMGLEALLASASRGEVHPEGVER